MVHVGSEEGNAQGKNELSNQFVSAKVVSNQMDIKGKKKEGRKEPGRKEEKEGATLRGR